MITYIGSASNPADLGTQAAGTLAIAPPVGMIAGDLCVVWAHSKDGSGWNMSGLGGQVWTPSNVSVNSSGINTRLFWCVFNGTWAGNPSVIVTTVGTAQNAVMHAYRPSAPASVWTLERDSASPTSDIRLFTHSTGTTERVLPSNDVLNASTVRIGVWVANDDTVFSAVGTGSTNGWVTPGSANYRNLAGTDFCSTYAHKIMTIAGASGSVGKTPSLNDDGGGSVVTFAEGPTVETFDEIYEESFAHTFTAEAVIEKPAPPPAGADASTTALAQETIFDLAIRLYGDIRGVADIIELNTLDPNAEDYFPQTIWYNSRKVYSEETFIVPLQAASRAPWKVNSGQTGYDLALQLYGEISGLEKIIPQIGLDDPAAGSQVVAETTDNYLANNLFNRSVVATAF